MHFFLNNIFTNYLRISHNVFWSYSLSPTYRRFTTTPLPTQLCVLFKKKKKIILSGMRLVPEHGQPIRSHPQRNQVSPNTYISTMYRCFKSVVLRRCMRTQCSWLGKGQKSHVKPQLNGSVHPGLNTLLLIHCIAPSHSVIKTWQTGTHLHWSSGE